MQHKYQTPAFVLARYPVREHDSNVILATVDFGIVRARATGLRKPGSKMAIGLQTFTESDVTIIRAKDGWRLTGALPTCNWAATLTFQQRTRAARIAELMRRLAQGEEPEHRLYETVLSFVRVLPTLSEDDAEYAEFLAALRILHILGHDAGELPGGFGNYEPEALHAIRDERKAYIARINNGIGASGL
ncbi:MAG TPA: recombination protein O N-terminal domain-containing protein [Candidatus Paceibacterota bacterium]|jgi:recombinational DNA repair protein (RecF pathway)